MDHRIPVAGRREKRFYTLFFTVLLALFTVATLLTQYNPFQLLFQGEAFWTFLTQDFLPPTLKDPAGILSAILTTVALAVSATSCALVLGFVAAVFASPRTSIFPRGAKVLRALVTLVRNIPSLIWAFILFSALGIGTGVAFVALTISSFAFMTRTFIEVIDELADSSLEALTAAGANFPQKVAHGVVPNCLLDFIEWYLYCMELNIRSSTIVGMVGGGGIGLVLFTYIKSFNYPAAAGIILIIATLVIAVDRLMAYTRQKVLNEA